MNRIVIAVASAAALATSAYADVHAVGEFAGETFETFENVALPGGYPGPLGIFGGNVTLDDSLAHTVVIAFNFTGPAGEVLPLGGNLFGAAPAGTAIFQFLNPVTRFGGWINTVGTVGGGTAVFKDASGSVIDTLSFDGTPVTWTWAGWESDTAISTIELTGNNGLGFGFQFDNLTLDYVPTPASLSLLGLGAVSAGRRRR